MQLVEENQYLTVFVPIREPKAFVFRVLSVANKGRESYHYGCLPISSGETLPTFDGTTATVPSDGVMPARAFTRVARTIPARVTNVYDSSDMWYTPETHRDTLYQVIHRLTPDFLRADVQIPIGTIQTRFQHGNVVVGVEYDFGFQRGGLEVIQFPAVHYGYRWGNDTNANLRTGLQFIYRELKVEIPDEPEVIWDVLVGRIRSYWYTLPVVVVDPALKDAWLKTYGFEGFKVYPLAKKDQAIEDYKNVLKVTLI